MSRMPRITNSCVQEGQDQPVMKQVLIIILIGLAYITFGKIFQAIFYKKWVIFPIISYLPILVMYILLLSVNYKKWIQINPNFTFLNSTQSPFIYDDN